MFGKKSKPSVITQAGDLFKERITKGDEILGENDEGTIVWRHEGVACQVVLPIPETHGIGVFQTHEVIEGEAQIHRIRRYFITDTGLMRATTVLLNPDEMRTIDENTFASLEALTDTGDVSDEDEAHFFTMLFSPFGSI